MRSLAATEAEASAAVDDADVARRWHRHWLCGGFPDAYAAGPDFRDWQEAYLRAYIERDAEDAWTWLQARGLVDEALLEKKAFGKDE